MKKIRLRLDDLRVDAFATTAAASAARGTVRGNDSIFTHQTCPPMTADDTCGMTCGPTCDAPSCLPDTTCCV